MKGCEGEYLSFLKCSDCYFEENKKKCMEYRREEELKKVIK